ncbi:MAG: EAL domain-containing protein [Clostridiales bacterium]|nr:EAL domain-containing protein [Clostridiales bacterium]
MQFHTKQLNKMTVMKAVTSLIIIMAVLIVSVVCIVFAATNAANKGALGTYESWGENLSVDVRTNAEERGITVSTSLTESQFASLFGGDRGFEGVAIVTSSRHVLYDSGDFLGELIPSGAEMPQEGTEVSVAKYGDKSYVLAISRLEGEYFTVGYIDFTASAHAISSMRKSVSAIFVVSALFIMGSFVAYVVTTGLDERGHRYKYKLTTDIEGRILSSNEAFKTDFPQTIRLYENVLNFSDNSLTAIKIPCYDDEVFVACAAKRTTKGNIKLTADLLSMPYNSQATKQIEMMNEMYSSFLPKHKTFLIGIINFADLPNIDTMFGREFTKSVHSVLYERIAKRFTYIYVLDTYNIGVLYKGGKDYSILLEDLKSIVDSYNEPIKIDENIVNVKTKCGFAVCDNNMAHRTFDYAMTSAEAALRRAKQDEQRDYYVFHSAEIKAYSKYFFNYDIREMLEDNMFEMEYQPQYGIKEGRIVGFEALFRVKKTANVMVDIFDLISYAERSGYMLLLSEFIFDTAMRFAKSVEDKNVTVSLNVSPVQLMQAGFCESFLEIYDRYNLREGSICVEITESFLVQNFEYAIKKLEILQEHGIEIHLDDFGTRYSSLLYLKKLPVRVIKIDREFVVDVTDNELDKSITEMIVNICNKHNLLCIAEGVETMEQYNELKKMGVDIIQGWLVSKSVPANDAIRLIDEFKLK